MNVVPVARGVDCIDSPSKAISEPRLTDQVSEGCTSYTCGCRVKAIGCASVRRH